MPLWRIFSHPSTFTLEQRAGIAKAVTAQYVARGLPAFYVNVIFVDVDETAVWVGGEPKKNFVRVVIEQIARTMSSPESEEGKKKRKAWMDEINKVRVSSPNGQLLFSCFSGRSRDVRFCSFD